jgi:hypothetical protein
MLLKEQRESAVAPKRPPDADFPDTPNPRIFEPDIPKLEVS